MSGENFAEKLRLAAEQLGLENTAKESPVTSEGEFKKFIGKTVEFYFRGNLVRGVVTKIEIDRGKVYVQIDNFITRKIGSINKLKIVG